MKKSFTRIIAIIAMAVMALCTVMFAACGGGSETYVGSVSAESYESTEKMGEAFVAHEINGDTTTAQFVSYESEKQLTETEVEELSLPETAKTGLKSVEKGKVNYSVITATAARAAGETYWKGVYVLNYGETYKYYTPAVANGETLTKSYFDSVFYADNYKNVTMTAKAVAQSKVSYGGQSATMKSTVTYTYKITETAVYGDMTVAVSGSGMSQKQTISFYITEVGGQLKIAASEGSNWYAANASDLGLEINSIEEIYALSNEGLDHTFFVKTSNGFKIDDEKVNAFLNQALEGTEYESLFGSMKVSGDASYVVKDGKLASGSAAFTLNGNIQGINMKVSSSATYKYTAFGTTEVTIPNEVKTVLGIN